MDQAALRWRECSLFFWAYTGKCSLNILWTMPACIRSSLCALPGLCILLAIAQPFLLQTRQPSDPRFRNRAALFGSFSSEALQTSSPGALLAAFFSSSALRLFPLYCFHASRRFIFVRPTGFSQAPAVWRPVQKMVGNLTLSCF